MAVLDEFLRRHSGAVKPAGEKHPALSFLLDIRDNKRPNPDRLFVAEGLWAVESVLKKKLHVNTLVIAPELAVTPEARTLFDCLLEKADMILAVSAKVFHKLSERENPDGLLIAASLPEWDISTLRTGSKSIIAVIDGLEIPGNLGTIIRTCDGAGVDAVIICGHRIRLTHPKVFKGSQGSILSVPVFEMEHEEAAQWLTEKGYTVFLADPSAQTSYRDTSYPLKTAVICGSERYGIKPFWYEHPHMAVSIPMRGGCDSLNAAVALSILLYEVSAHPEK